MKTKLFPCPGAVLSLNRNYFRAISATLLIGLCLASRVAFGFSIQPAGSVAIVSWGVSNTVLQSRSDLVTGSWTNVSGATSPYYAPGLEPKMFFRLVYGVGGPLPTNLPPTVANFSVSGVHDKFLVAPAPGVLTNASDPNGLAISAVLLSNPENGTVALNADGSFTYTPNSGFIGTDSFTFYGVDELTSSPPATVYITLTDAAPVAQNDSYAVTANQILNVAAPGVLVNDSDTDGDTISAVFESSPSNGTLTLNADGSFTYTPDASFTGMDSFTYQVTDGLKPGNTATVTINVHTTDTAPIAGNGTYSIAHDQVLSVAAPGVLSYASDADGDPLTISLGTSPANGMLNLDTDGSFTYSPNAGFVGTDSFTYTVNDGLSNSSPGTITINVMASQPVASNDVYYVHQNSTLTVSAPGVLLNDTDPDNQPLSAVLDTPPINGGLTFSPDGSFIYSGNTNFSGTDSFTYYATDGISNSSPATVTIYVTNRPPVAVADAYGVHTNTTLNVPAPGVLNNDYDPDGDALTTVLNTSPANGSLTLNSDGSFSYTPNNGFIGTDSFTYKASDGLALSAPVSVTLTVHDTNAPPVSAPSEYIIRPNDTLTVDVAGSELLDDSDADGDPLTAQLLAAPAHGSLTFNTNGTFVYTPNAGYAGLDSFVYQPFDGLVGGNPAPVFIIITNSPPVAQPDLYEVHFNTALTVEAPGVLENDSDADDDELIAGLITPPANGTLALDEDGGFTYLPNTNFIGVDSFTYVANDGISGSAAATVTISVTDNAPTASDDSYQTPEDTTLNITADAGVLANDDDADFDTLTAVLATGPSHGSLTLNSDGSFIYTPNAGFAGTDTFTYTASDGLLSTVPATVTITVNNVVLAARPNAGAPAALTIQQVIFTGGYGNNRQLLPDTPGMNGQPANYDAPQFLELGGTGIFNPLVRGDRSFPYIYANDSTLELQAKFTARNIPAGAAVKLRADAVDLLSGDIITTFGGGIKAGGAGFAGVVGSGVVSTGRRSVSADTAFDNGSTYYKLGISWQFQVNGGAWVDCNGMSDNVIFHTFLAPQVPTCPTLVGNACASARAVGGVNGLNDTRAILNALWAQRFVPKKAQRWDGATLSYYGRWNPALHIHSIAGLLQTQDGECDTWAQFMIASLQAQGIEIANFVGVRPNTRNGEALLVQTWNFPAGAAGREYPWVNYSTPVGTADSIYPTFKFAGPPNVNFFGNWQYVWQAVPAAPQWTYTAGVAGKDGGQNQPNPVATFYNHCIVRIGDAAGMNNKYYDPSYGSTYGDLLVMEKKALSGFYRARGVNTRFDIRAGIGNGGMAIAPGKDIPQLAGGNLLERNAPSNLQFFSGADAFAPDSDGQPDNAALKGGAVAPVKTKAGGAITVWIVDSYGRVADSSSFVTIIIGNNPAGASLCNGANVINAGGPRTLNPNRITVQAVKGVATFPAFNINASGDAFTLKAYLSTATGSPRANSTPAVSQMFDVGP